MLKGLIGVMTRYELFSFAMQCAYEHGETTKYIRLKEARDELSEEQKKEIV